VTPAGGRDLSLDVLRGIAVGGMVLVNLQSNPAGAYRQLVHADWHGVTFADTVFPLFLLAVGISAALVADRAHRPSVARVLRRAALLFAIGLALGWLLRPTLDPGEVRVMGVLQRIAIVYAVAAILCRSVRGGIALLAFAGGVLLLHGWLLMQAPPDGMASLARGEGMSGWSDRLLPGRLFRPSYDPEGVLSTLSAFATAAIGAGAARLGRRRVRSLAAIGLGSLIAAMLAASVLPYNKPLWTPSFALLNAGGGLLLWAALKLANDRFPGSLLRPLAWLGNLALTLYVVHMLLLVVLIQYVGGERLWTLADQAIRKMGVAPAPASLAFALLAGGLSVAITRWLDRRGWRIRV
jgi:predicted acyltransferase